MHAIGAGAGVASLALGALIYAGSLVRILTGGEAPGWWSLGAVAAIGVGVGLLVGT